MITPLSTLLTRMNRWQTIATIEEQYKVSDLDEAIRAIKRDFQLPWLLKQTTLRVFDGVLQYPVPTDYDYFAYIDTSQTNILGSQGDYGSRFRARYTSLQQFFEDLDNRNTVADIIVGNTHYLGVRDKIINAPSNLVDTGSSASNYTAHLDASNPVTDNVLFITQNSSVRFTNTNTTNSAKVSWQFTAFQNTMYQRSFFFVYVYLSGLPTSITMEIGNDASNNFFSTLTTQFDGQPFLINAWNYIAIDLNTATELGAVDASNFHYAALTFTDAPSGDYNINASYLRQWELLNFYYYSNYACQTLGATSPDREFFNDASLSYSLDTSLIGDAEWADVVMYDAAMTSIADKENDKVYPVLKAKRDDSWDKLAEVYPSMKPLIITQSYRFETDYNGGDGWGTWGN